MSESYLSVLEAISDPWALFLISVLVAGAIVVSTAAVLDPRPKAIEEAVNEPEDFFDKITRYHNEL